MQTKPKSKYFALLMALSLLFALWGCNGSNNNSDDNLVRGNVAQVLTAMNDVEAEPAQAAHWTAFLAFVAKAHAQGEDLSGITVIATIDDVVVDETVTDADGNFTLHIANGGEVVLTFSTDDFEATVTITVPDDSDVTVTVSIESGEETTVVIDEMEVAYHPIRCAGSETITLEHKSETLDGENPTYVIDGHGDTCMRATGQCTINTDETAPVNIEFRNCDQCIRAEGGATIDLSADWVSCEEASEDAISARGNSSVAVEVEAWMSFIAAKVGVDARGNSKVALSMPAGDEAEEQAGDEAEKEAPEKRILVMGEEADIRARGNATVEIIGECEAQTITQDDNASVMECQQP